MENIHEISQKLRQLGRIINDYLVVNQKSIVHEDSVNLYNLASQCNRLADLIIIDHFDIGIAYNCYEHLNRELAKIIANVSKKTLQ